MLLYYIASRSAYVQLQSENQPQGNTPNNNRTSFVNMPSPQQHVNIHDVTDPPVSSPPPDEYKFHESLEHDNDDILAHFTQS